MDTHDFAYQKADTMSTVKQVPISPPKPPLSRNRSQGATSSHSLKSPTPPIPAKSPHRPIPSPEPFPPSTFTSESTLQRHISSPTAFTSPYIQRHSAPPPPPPPPPREHAQSYAQIRTIPPPVTHQIQLRDLDGLHPTSYYAPQIRPAPIPTPKPTRNNTNTYKHAHHNTRLALRVFVFVLLTAGLATDLTELSDPGLDIVFIAVVRSVPSLQPFPHTHVASRPPQSSSTTSSTCSAGSSLPAASLQKCIYSPTLCLRMG